MLSDLGSGAPSYTKVLTKIEMVIPVVHIQVDNSSWRHYRLCFPIRKKYWLLLEPIRIGSSLCNEFIMGNLI